MWRLTNIQHCCTHRGGTHEQGHIANRGGGGGSVALVPHVCANALIRRGTHLGTQLGGHINRRVQGGLTGPCHSVRHDEASWAQSGKSQKYEVLISVFFEFDA